jgi:60S ribosomal subunit assembly/export protein LOC1
LGRASTLALKSSGTYETSYAHPSTTVAMGVTRTKTVKNKHAAPAGGAKSSKRSATEGVTKSKKPKGTPPSKQVKDKGREALLQKFKNPKKKKYTDEQLGIPALNTVTPVGVVKPRGKKKGKVFADDQVRLPFLTVYEQF